MGSTPTTVKQEPVELRIDPEQWSDAVQAADGPQIVVGGPGTGKTEFLVRRVAYLVQECGVAADAILVVSFGRRGVADLSRRIRDRLDFLDRPVAPVPVVTFHSLAADILDADPVAAGWSSPPQILTGPEQTALVRGLLQTEDVAPWAAAFRGLLGTVTFAEEVTDFLLRASEQMLTPEDIAEFGRNRDDWRGLPQFMRRYRAELERAGRIDYGMLLADATAICEQGDAILDRFSHVLVDEYQDTTVSQARLLAALSAQGHNLTAAADPYQSIYSFRGAAVQNVARFPTMYRSPDGTLARRIVLTTSFRTPAAILASAERVAAHTLPGAAGPVRPARGAGRVDVHVFDQHTAEAEWIASEAIRLHLEDRIPFAQMAVFVRSKRRFLPELSRALQRRGIPHEHPDSRLAEQPAVRFVLDLVAAATAAEEPEQARPLRRILLGPWFGLPLGSLRDIERLGRSVALSWAEALRAADASLAPLAAMLEDPAWATTIPAREGVWKIWSTLPQLDVVARDPERCQERAAWASLSQVLEQWNERNPEATLLDYRRLLVEEEFEAQPLLSYTMPHDDRLTVTTLHQAKGLEFDVVFIADAVEGVFPDLRVRDSLLGVRHLLPDVPHEPGPYQRFRLQEERRLAYTAMTRAARRVVWTATSTGFEEGRGIPSRFLALAAGTATVADAAMPVTPRRNPVTIAEAEAMMRRIVGDPGEPEPRRYAAIDILAKGPRWGLRDPWTFGGLRSRGPDTGLVGRRLRLSPSQADAYTQCPRRYAVQRRLGIGEGTGPHATVGQLVHAVLELADRRALERGDDRSTLADASAALGELFDAAAFGGEPFATAWRRRAETSIVKLHADWPSNGRLVDVERCLEMRLGDVDWVGYVDRIEARGRALAIVDYKTSGTMISRDEAAKSIQLGFYMLAARQDAALAEWGEPVFAEYWYPYASRKMKSLGIRSFDPANLGEVADRLRTAAAGITSEDWRPLPSEACDRCPVRRVCPAQPQGTEGFLA
jgi:superfamily I DNA/RNA helicase